MKSLLLALARSHQGGRALRFWLRRFPWALPFRTLYRDRSVVAFRHPSPSYATHILILPLPPIAGPGVIEEEHGSLLLGSLRCAKTLASRLSLKAGWRLVANGGSYQHVGVLHFHLIPAAKA